MDLSINNVNFGGKREVVYGLTKAAKSARYMESCRAMCEGPRPLSYKALDGKSSEASIRAYMDMAVFDDEFVKTIKEFPKDKAEELKSVLKPEKWQFSSINPLKEFKKAMFNSMKEHDKTVETDVLNDFIKSITNK